MPSFRKRMAIQKQPKKKKEYVRKETFAEREERFNKLKSYLNRGISMYHDIMSSFEPFSDAQKICIDNIMTFTYELEIVRNGTNEEREEVYIKYGEYIG